MISVLVEYLDHFINSSQEKIKEHFGSGSGKIKVPHPSSHFSLHIKASLKLFVLISEYTYIDFFGSFKVTKGYLQKPQNPTKQQYKKGNGKTKFVCCPPSSPSLFSFFRYFYFCCFPLFSLRNCLAPQVKERGNDHKKKEREKTHHLLKGQSN
ncbi:unnamed protein product [Meloidogyne enterolobii]|uniref:Uncharacterized protein n=1 Tax=Meloidogyne enterolobii TaxID=390850 RepID=A0ACB1A8I1_MELEN